CVIPWTSLFWVTSSSCPSASRQPPQSPPRIASGARRNPILITTRIGSAKPRPDPNPAQSRAVTPTTATSLSCLLWPEGLERLESEVRGPVLRGAGHDDGLIAAADGRPVREHVVVGGLDLVEDGGADQPDQRQFQAQIAVQLVEQRAALLVQRARACDLEAN